MMTVLNGCRVPLIKTIMFTNIQKTLLLAKCGGDIKLSENCVRGLSSVSFGLNARTVKDLCSFRTSRQCWNDDSWKPRKGSPAYKKVENSSRWAKECLKNHNGSQLSMMETVGVQIPYISSVRKSLVHDEICTSLLSWEWRFQNIASLPITASNPYGEDITVSKTGMCRTCSKDTETRLRKLKQMSSKPQ
ncbi:hypothetical protein TNCV_2282561 [Trichonephila clavipes]|nr:hypothetical protein TNCV_2282561 [Trichonephila clavipes]